MNGMISHGFIKDFLTYSAGSVITQASNILLILFLMHHLTADQVGFFSLTTSSVLLISTLISLGLRQFFMLEFFTLCSDKKKEFVSDLVTLYLMVSFIFMFFAWHAYPFINTLFFANNAPKWLYFCIMVQVFLTFFTELFYQALMYTLKSIQVTLLKSFIALFILFVSLFSIYFFKNGVEAILMTQCVTSFALCLYGLLQYHRYSLFNYHDIRRTIFLAQPILKKSLPLVPTVLAGLLLASGNRWVLSMHTHLADVAVYSLAEYVAPLFNLLILYPLSGAYLPRIMTRFNEKLEALRQTEAENKRLMWGSMCALFSISTIVYLLAKPHVLHFLPATYYAAIPGAYAILLGNILLMGTYFSSSLLLYKKKSYHMLVAITIAAVVNIGISYMLVPLYGIQACFFSYIIAYLIYFILIYIFNRLAEI